MVAPYPQLVEEVKEFTRDPTVVAVRLEHVSGVATLAQLTPSEGALAVSRVRALEVAQDAVEEEWDMPVEC